MALIMIATSDRLPDPRIEDRSSAGEPAECFCDRNFALGCLVIGLFGGVIYGVVTLLPLFYQTLLGYTAAAAGLAVSPRGIGAICDHAGDRRPDGSARQPLAHRHRLRRLRTDQHLDGDI